MQVQRKQHIARSREDLPIIKMEGDIMDAVLSTPHGVTIVCGATGSGKTTQVCHVVAAWGWLSRRSDCGCGLHGPLLQHHPPNACRT